MKITISKNFNGDYALRSGSTYYWVYNPHYDNWRIYHPIAEGGTTYRKLSDYYRDHTEEVKELVRKQMVKDML